MAQHKTKKCYGCHQVFRREELVDYASPRAKILQSYCPACLQEKQAKDRFSDRVCTIFGIKSPGARIWGDRKRLKETYGYTDDIIIDCLDYIYNVEKKKKTSESLCLINPITVEKMLKYKRNQTIMAQELTQAMQTELKEYIVPIKENTKKVKITTWNPDDWLED